MRKTVISRGAVVSVWLSVSHVVFAQRVTIPEALSRAGTSLVGEATIPSGPPPSIGVVLADVDVVVKGTVGEDHSYLSDDQMEVLTDYKIENASVLHARDPIGSNQLGASPVITVTVFGGTVSIGTLRYTSIWQALPRLDRGTQVLLLLKRNGDRYYIARQFYGAFGMSDGHLKVLTRKHGFAPEYTGMPAARAEQAIVAQLRGLEHRK